MAQTPKLCCPEPSVRNALHPHEVPDSSKGIPTTPGYACTNPLFVQSCPPTEPPTPITLEGQDCEGNAVDATGLPGQIMHAVQAPGTVFKVQLCDAPKDIEKVVLCEKGTGHKIAVITDLSDPANPVVTTWNLNTGAPWTGDFDDLESCPDTDIESDPVEMCDAGVQFLRWVVKSNGEPTGAKFDTDLTGAPYTVTNEAGVTLGKCVAVCADIVIRDCNGAAMGYGYSPTLAPLVGATVEMTNCSGGAVYGFIMAAADANHTVPITLGCGDGAEVCGFAAATGCEKPGLDVETHVMCDAGTNFVRTFVYEDGALVAKRDHTKDAKPYTVTNEANVKFGACVAEECEQGISSAFADDLSSLIPGTSISVQKPDCCILNIETDVGTFIVGKHASGLSTDTFKCPVTVLSVTKHPRSGDCDLADVIITTQNSILV